MKEHPHWESPISWAEEAADDAGLPSSWPAQPRPAALGHPADEANEIAAEVEERRREVRK